MKKDSTKGHYLFCLAIKWFEINILSIQCLFLFRLELIKMFTYTKWVALSRTKINIENEICDSFR